MTDRQPGIVSAWRRVFPLSGVRASGVRLVQRGVVGMPQFLTGCSRLDTAKHGRPSKVRPATRHGLGRFGRSGPCSEWTRSVLRAGRGAVGTLVSMGNLKSQVV